MCGNCCSGSSGSVRFTDEEAVTMAFSLNISLIDFFDRYTRTKRRGSVSYYELKEVKLSDGKFDCIFLDRNAVPGKAICSLYKSRPSQCKSWPFWPEVLESLDVWEESKFGVDGCPGLGVGQRYSFIEIEDQLQKTIKDRELL